MCSLAIHRANLLFFSQMSQLSLRNKRLKIETSGKSPITDELVEFEQ